LKALAVYRDGCKGSQPLSAGGKAQAGDRVLKEEKTDLQDTTEPDPISPQPLVRFRLPKKRKGFTQESRVGASKVYVRTGEYDDGTLGEIFLDMHKAGADLRSMMNCFAIAISIGLQYGVPLKEFVDCFTFTKFEPQGVVTGHRNIKFSTSIIDYIFRVLGYEYLGMTEFLQIKPGEDDAEERQTATTSGLPGDAQSTPARASEKVVRGDGEAALSDYLSAYVSDAPFCDQCGHITVRNGACYKCLNCGNSLGCS